MRKLQLLSHQYLIASVVELYVGHFTSDGHTSLEHAKFHRLGYISLSENEASRYKVIFSASVYRDYTRRIACFCVVHGVEVGERGLYWRVGQTGFVSKSHQRVESLQSSELNHL